MIDRMAGALFCCGWVDGAQGLLPNCDDDSDKYNEKCGVLGIFNVEQVRPRPRPRARVSSFMK